MPKLDDAYRDQLTAEEIAAFEAETEDDAVEALDALANPPDDDPDDPDHNAGGADTPPAATGDDTVEGGEGGGGAADPDDPAPQAPPKAEEKPKEEPAPEPAPDAAAAQAALDAAKAERKDLRDKYNDGDMTDEEYDSAIEAIEDKIAEAGADIKSAQRHIGKQREAWKQAGQSYLERYPGLKADGIIQALDKAVQELAQYPSVANLPHDQFLERVHRKLIAESEYTRLEIPPIEGANPKRQERTPPEGDDSLGKPPRTLANAPASDVSALDDSPYASLERMAEKGNPVDFEAAMMKLPADKRDEFASMMIE